VPLQVHENIIEIEKTPPIIWRLRLGPQHFMAIRTNLTLSENVARDNRRTCKRRSLSSCIMSSESPLAFSSATGPTGRATCARGPRPDVRCPSNARRYLINRKTISIISLHALYRHLHAGAARAGADLCQVRLCEVNASTHRRARGASLAGAPQQRPKPAPPSNQCADADDHCAGP
jgi:hypothetical protein